MRASPPPAEVDVDARLVRGMLRAQHPDLAGLPLRRIGAGWDNEVLRLGRDLVVRVPRREMGARLLDTELRWLPELAPRLPLAAPVPVRRGEPMEGYPWRWSICRYVRGRPVGATALAGEQGQAGAVAIAGFLRALHVPAPADAPRSLFRGVPLAARADAVERALPAVPAADRAHVRSAWCRAVETPLLEGPALWLHGDLHGGNVMGQRGRISGVIDFGDLCAGDPATDLAVAWLVLDGPGRERLRSELEVPNEAWERGRGWALFLGLMFLLHGDAYSGAESMGARALQALLGR